jgi:hypothetical protein
LHEKIVELHSRIVSLEADLKVPIPTSCSTCYEEFGSCKMCWLLAR